MKVKKNTQIKALSIIILLTLMSCSQSNTTVEIQEVDNTSEDKIVKVQKPHRYGGWYCPDNLRGFPAVDINNWEEVPVVNGRMPTKEETQNGTSLIFVDTEQYPEAKQLDLIMPKLAKFYNVHSKKEEVIIVIQTLKISSDSLVGFRYLNGGNGSARISEVKFLSEDEISGMSSSSFVSHDIIINATQDVIWEVLTKPKYSKVLQAIFDQENKLPVDWNKSSKVNFKYLHEGSVTSEFAENLFGNQYIQIDYKIAKINYVEKFLLITDLQTKTTELQIVCGPYHNDFESQKLILNNWAQKVKELSERS